MSTLQEKIVRDIMAELLSEQPLTDAWDSLEPHVAGNMLNMLEEIVAGHVEKAYGSPYAFRRNEDDTATISTDKNGNETTLWDDDNTQ